jgi:hypothetical protein
MLKGIVKMICLICLFFSFFYQSAAQQGSGNEPKCCYLKKRSEGFYLIIPSIHECYLFIDSIAFCSASIAFDLSFARQYHSAILL